MPTEMITVQGIVCFPLKAKTAAALMEKALETAEALEGLPLIPSQKGIPDVHLHLDPGSTRVLSAEDDEPTEREQEVCALSRLIVEALSEEERDELLLDYMHADSPKRLLEIADALDVDLKEGSEGYYTDEEDDEEEDGEG